MPRRSDPIAAISTAAGRGAVGIVRVSGAELSRVIQAICGSPLKPRHATYLAFLDAVGMPIDHGLAIYFPAPHSYTGEDVLELQAHGGPVVLQLLIRRCLEVGGQSGLRVAEPGEFTQRAFLNGKIDLAQAEAVADLIDASTVAAARSASRSLDGAFSAEISALLGALINLRMLLEATLDFPEDEVDVLGQLDGRAQISALLDTLHQIRQKVRQGVLLREGIKVVIAGQPNVGKSSLLNALAGAERAIVSPIAGTTRDTVQQTIQIEGVALHVIDTAGLRDSSDEIEKIGVARAWAEIDDADAVVFLHDLTCLDPSGPQCAHEITHLKYNSGDTLLAERLASRVHVRVPIVDVWNKLDAVQTALPATSDLVIHLSAKTGAGLDSLRHTLLRLAGWQSGPEGIYMARQRHIQILDRVQTNVLAALAHYSPGSPALDLVAEELRLAQNALSEITGAFTSDDLLGIIFSRFCIGK